ncbi:hypothetical protein DYU11_11620 [Fibrisoma montanum]|uniref:Uncharacterized protein n=1 Tax=Fibrisoma montanum TaxID=2305895 RepID=A0A418MB70_9BACT|nr:hypothetical protein [Fibrisoma montanum]RIV23623.1 hypothetical protein DYU11_11620 [Fibrisoma montanum]
MATELSFIDELTTQRPDGRLLYTLAVLGASTLLTTTNLVENHRDQMITKQQTNELYELLEKFADDLGATIDAETDVDSLEILRPIHILVQQLGNELEPIL